MRAHPMHQKYIHELIMWNGLWYFKLPRHECHRMCVEILEIQQAFREVSTSAGDETLKTIGNMLMLVLFLVGCAIPASPGKS